MIYISYLYYEFNLKIINFQNNPKVSSFGLTSGGQKINPSLFSREMLEIFKDVIM